jgi:hypothetical protein
LSVVAQALLLLYLSSAGEELLSGDVDERCQWVVQTNEGWAPY